MYVYISICKCSITDNTAIFGPPLTHQVRTINLFQIYIVMHRQTVSLYHNSSVWLDTQDASSWDRNPPNFASGLVYNCSTIASGLVSNCSTIDKAIIFEKEFNFANGLGVIFRRDGY